MITPVNNHVLIEPIVRDSFISSTHETFEEVGVVVATPSDWDVKNVQVNDKIFFDSWMCSKYPKNETEFFWLVPWSEVRAIEKHEEVSE